MTVLYQHGSYAIGQEQSLVRINNERVSAFNTPKKVFLVRQNKKATVGGVNVKPQSVLLRNISQSLQWINGTGLAAADFPATASTAPNTGTASVRDIPVDNIYAAPILLADVHKQQIDNVMVVSPDVGGVVRARALAKRLDCDLAIIDKRRPKANVAEGMNIIGDVTGRTCVIMDDMVDTANTLVKAAAALKEHGAQRVLSYCTHPVLSGGAVDRILNSSLDELVVTDTIPLPKDARASSKIRVISCAQLLAETILRINRADSVSSLFVD